MAAWYKNKKLLIALSSAVGLGIVLYLFHTLPFREVFSQFKGTPLSLLAAYGGAIVFIQVMLSARWKEILKARDLDQVSFWDLNNYRLIGAAVSFLTPTAKLGGEPVRAMILHQETEMDFKEALSTVVIDKTIDLTASGLFFIIGVAVIVLNFTLQSGFQNLLIGVMVFLTLFISLFYFRVFNGQKFFSWICKKFKLHKFSWLEGPLKGLNDLEELVVDFYHADKKGFVVAILVSLLSWMGMFAEYYFAGLIVGFELSFLQVFLVFTFVGIAYIIPVPMAVGTLEAGQVSVFRIIGLPSASGLGLSLVVRAKDMLITIYGLTCLAFSGVSLTEALEEAGLLSESE
jgi:hypothetical protein